MLDGLFEMFLWESVIVSAGWYRMMNSYVKVTVCGL